MGGGSLLDELNAAFDANDQGDRARAAMSSILSDGRDPRGSPQITRIIRENWRSETDVPESARSSLAKLIQSLVALGPGISGRRAGKCCDYHETALAEAFAFYGALDKFTASDFIRIISNLAHRMSDAIRLDPDEEAGASQIYSVFKTIEYVKHLLDYPGEGTELITLSDLVEATAIEDSSTDFSFVRAAHLRKWKRTGSLSGIFGQARGARSMLAPPICKRPKIFCAPTASVDALTEAGASVEDILAILGLPFKAKERYVEICFNLNEAIMSRWADAELPSRGWKLATPTVLDANHWMYWPCREARHNKTRDIRSNEPGVTELLLAPFSTSAIVDIRTWPEARWNWEDIASNCYLCSTYANVCGCKPS